MDPAVLAWLTKLLAAEGYAVIHRTKIKTIRSTVSIDREVMVCAQSVFQLKNRVDELARARLAETLLRTPRLVAREQEALTDGLTTRFNLEMTVIEGECKALTTT